MKEEEGRAVGGEDSEEDSERRMKRRSCRDR
jgi:hypothetical protein